MFELST